MTIRALVIEENREHRNRLIECLKYYGGFGIEAAGTLNGKPARVSALAMAPHLIIHGCNDVLFADEETIIWKFAYNYLNTLPNPRPYMVALVAHESKRQKAMCLEMGYDEYVTKPREVSHLIEWINQGRKVAEGVKAI